MLKKLPVAVFVSGGGTNLNALFESTDRGEMPSCEIVLVCSDNPDAYALTRAKERNIKTFCADKKVIGRDAFESEVEKALENCGAELIVLAGFLSILSERFTKKYANRIINIHPSLIPSFCGMGCYGIHVHEKALAYGVKVTGATVHFVNEIPDGGKIIMQKAVDILEGDTPEILQKRVMEEAEWKILPLAVEKVASSLISGDLL